MAGISIANSTVPDASSRSNSASSCATCVTLKYRVFSQRREDRAAEIALFLQQHRGRQMARRGVDGVAEQQKLHQRDHDDHRERDAVALELDELLDQHRPGAAPEAAAALVAAGHRDGHWKLSCAWPMRSMNTSSSDGSECFQVRPGSLAIGRDRRFERRLVAAGDMQAGAERRHHVDAGTLPVELLGELGEAFAVRRADLVGREVRRRRSPPRRVPCTSSTP